MKNTIFKKIEKERRLGETTALKFEALFSLEEEIPENENATAKEKALAKALNDLSDRQREIIYLRYECGMEYKQICEIMDLKNDSARKLVFRAIKTLRAIIEDQLKFPFCFFCDFLKNILFNTCCRHPDKNQLKNPLFRTGILLITILFQICNPSLKSL